MKKTILIVEDDLKAAAIATDFFSTKYKVYVANDLDDALRLLKNCKFDLVITDTFYPQATGKNNNDYLEFLKKETLDIIIDGVKDGGLQSTALSEDVREAIQSWQGNSQPLGLWLIKKLLEENFPAENIIMTTNLSHHEKLFEPIWLARIAYPFFPYTLTDFTGDFTDQNWTLLQECNDGNPEGKYRKSFWKGIAILKSL